MFCRLFTLKDFEKVWVGPRGLSEKLTSVASLRLFWGFLNTREAAINPSEELAPDPRTLTWICRPRLLPSWSMATIKVPPTCLGTDKLSGSWSHGWWFVSKRALW